MPPSERSRPVWGDARKVKRPETPRCARNRDERFSVTANIGLMVTYRFVVGEQDDSGRFVLIRKPDDLALSAAGWDDVWAACPEFNVPWRSVSFKDDGVRQAVLGTWGAHGIILPQTL